MSVPWCPLAVCVRACVCVSARADPSLSPPRLAPAAGCCSWPALSASEPAGSWREKPSRGEVSECVWECVCARAGPKLETTTEKHTRSRFRRTGCRHYFPESGEKPPRRPRNLRDCFFSFFFFCGVSSAVAPRGLLGYLSGSIGWSGTAHWLCCSAVYPPLIQREEKPWRTERFLLLELNPTVILSRAASSLSRSFSRAVWDASAALGSRWQTVFTRSLQQASDTRRRNVDAEVQKG